jgi:hypothetical protein
MYDRAHKAPQSRVRFAVYGSKQAKPSQAKPSQAKQSKEEGEVLVVGGETRSVERGGGGAKHGTAAVAPRSDLCIYT